MKRPDDKTISCGCRIKFDDDGLIRLAWCAMHSSAPEMQKEIGSLKDQRDALLKACKESERMLSFDDALNDARACQILASAIALCDKEGK